MDGPFGILTIAAVTALVIGGAAFYFLIEGQFRRFVVASAAIVALFIIVAILWMPRTTPVTGVRFVLAGVGVLAWLLIAAYFEMRRALSTLDRNQAILDEIAGTDELTGIATRQVLVGRCDTALAETSSRERVCLITANIDRFRTVNDALGPQAGDQLLRAVGAIFGNLAGEHDCAARIGSDEFALLLTNRPLVDALQTAELIRSKVARIRLTDTHDSVAFSVSVGVSSTPTGKHDTEWLMTAADAAVAESRRKGRNQVSSSPDPVTAPKEAAPESRPVAEPA